MCKKVMNKNIFPQQKSLQNVFSATKKIAKILYGAFCFLCDLTNFAFSATLFGPFLLSPGLDIYNTL
tara:strand:+ start:370 stop:570 length:201 start_codon:yes stop_codon:yes gene_type:complete